MELLITTEPRYCTKKRGEGREGEKDKREREGKTEGSRAVGGRER